MSEGKQTNSQPFNRGYESWTDLNMRHFGNGTTLRRSLTWVYSANIRPQPLFSLSLFTLASASLTRKTHIRVINVSRLNMNL